MRKSQLYYINEVKKMKLSEIRENKINRILAKSNYDSETFSEFFVAEKIKPQFLKRLCNEMQKLNCSHSSVFFMAATEEYKPYIWEP